VILRRRSFLKLTGVASVCAIVLATVVVIAGSVAQASNGDPVLLGFGNSATSGTSISTTGSIGLLVGSSDISGAGLIGQGHIGVEGESGNGIGVWGTTSDNTRPGVFGENTATTGGGGAGVVGVAQHNTGVQAISSNGTALEVDGVASFTRSGKATVPAGSAKVTVQNVKLSKGSMILATVQQAGRPAVRAAVPSVANNRFTIYLVTTTAKKAVVAWFVLS